MQFRAPAAHRDQKQQQQQQQPPPVHCGFCLRNNEPPSIYTSHKLKDQLGRVTCPQLFRYRCELCGATGAQAHTRSYCPNVLNLNRAREQQAAGGGGWAPEAPQGAGRAPGWRQQAGQGQPARPQRPQQAPRQWAGPQAWQRRAEPAAGIELGSARMFRNMSSVTCTRHNSAGMPRKVHNDTL